VRPRVVIALLSLVGGLIALYLTLYKVGVVGNLSCSVGSCETVNLSRWSTLLGFPIAAWGLGTYVVLLALSLVGVQERFELSRGISMALLALSGWSVLYSAWLTYLELFVIEEICIWCVGSAVVMVGIFIASIVDWRETGRHAAPGIAHPEPGDAIPSREP
jgi:uncharacterized membrane protein